MTKTSAKEKDHALEQAIAHLKSVKKMVKALNDAAEKDDDGAREKAEQVIREDALDVSVRSGWSNLEQGKLQPEEYRILLCTGGPAVQLTGDLDQYNQPESARLQYQDWFTPWTDYNTDSEDEAALLGYARQFYFGE